LYCSKIGDKNSLTVLKLVIYLIWINWGNSFVLVAADESCGGLFPGSIKNIQSEINKDGSTSHF
jgi:hypothetical protein